MDAAARGRRQPEGWRIGTLLGVPVLVARSWFVIAAVITIVFAPTVLRQAPGLGGASYAVAFLFAILLFGSVLVHELAHAAAARAVGMPARHIVINLWGGHTQFDSDATTPGRSFLVAVVGPLSNAALAAAAVPLLLATGDQALAGLLVRAFVLVNAVVALFNLVPGLPLDGGRVLEAVVWKVTGDRSSGTLVAGWGGRAVAVLVVAWYVVRPLLSGLRPSLVTVVWAGLIGALLWAGAGQAIAVAKVRRRAPAASVRALARPAVTVPGTASIAEGLRAAGAGHPADLARAPVLLLSPDGGLAGVLDAAAVSDVPPDRRGQVPAGAAARALTAEAGLDVRLGGEELLRVLSGLPGEEWPVHDEAGRWVGLLKGADVVAAMVGNRRSPSRAPRG